MIIKDSLAAACIKKEVFGGHTTQSQQSEEEAYCVRDVFLDVDASHHFALGDLEVV